VPIILLTRLIHVIYLEMGEEDGQFASMELVYSGEHPVKMRCSNSNKTSRERVCADNTQ
jgi:hypothetical protein